LVAAAVVALTAIGVLVASRRDGPPPGVNPRQSLLVLPFDNLREDSALEWLRDGSVNMLTLSLSQWRDLSVVDQHRVHDLMAGTGSDRPGPIGLDLARRLARAGGAWTLVLGDFSRAGDSLHLVARTYDVASGRRLEVIQVDGLAGDDVRPLFDEMAAHLLDLSGAPAEGRATLASATTASLAAYRSYLHGVDALNHWRLAEASAALERAVAIDSSFGLAHFRLAVTRGWMSPFDTLGQLAIRRASRSSERLPHRERGLIEGYRAFVEGDFDRALELYNELVTRDSADVEAWYGLGDASFHGGYQRQDVLSLKRSLEAMRRVVGLDSAYSLAYEHLGQLLTDAAAPTGWFLLASADSLVAAAGLGNEAARVARVRAQGEAVASARGWIRA
jgi:TolB-like protein